MNQLEKFKAKYAMDKLDEGSFLKAEIAKKERILEKIAEALRDEQSMKESGGIVEAAAVFSYSGMEFFAKSFGNSVESIFREEIAPAIQDTVRGIVRDELANVLRGLLRGQQQAIEAQLSSVMQIATISALDASESVLKSEVVTQKKETPAPVRFPKRKKKREITDPKTMRKEAKIIAEYLKKEDREVRLKEMCDSLAGLVNFRNNASSKMILIRKYDKNIIKVGNGCYTYQKGEVTT